MPIRFSLPKARPVAKAVVSEAEAQQYLAAGYKLLPRRRYGKCVLVKRREEWEKFEEEVLLFLEHGLKLQDVNGGAACRVSGHQIDAMGGLERSFFVLECKSRKELGRKSLRSALSKLWVQKRIVAPGIRKLAGKRYSTFHYVLVLKGITPTYRDLAYAKSRNITVWSESYFESLRALYLMIGERVRYYILKELGAAVPRVGRGKGAYFEFPVMANRADGDSVFSLFVPARILLDVAYVLRIESGQKKAYQRFLDRSRLTKIAKFLEDGNSFRNSILLGLDKRSRFQAKNAAWARSESFKSEVGVLRVPREFASAWVIDGQHRLYGYARADISHLDELLPVIAIKAKSKADEANTFIHINQNQKPVNPNLIWALLGTLRPESPEGVISSVVKRLAEQPGSVFRGMVYVPGESKHSRRHYRIFHANLCKTISEHYVRGRRQGFEVIPDEGTLSRKTRGRVTDILYRILNTWFNEMGRIADGVGIPHWKQGFFYTNNGTNVLCRVLVQILKFSNGRLDRVALRTTFGKGLEAYLRDNQARIDSIRRFTSSEGSRDQEAAKIVRAVALHVSGFAEPYLKEHRIRLEGEEPYRLLKGLEGVLRSLISEELSGITAGWWKQRIPSDVRENARNRKERRERIWPWLEAKGYSSMHYVDFGDYSKSIARNDNWDECFKDIFRDKEVVLVKLREVEQIRNEIAHSRDLNDIQLDTLRLNSKYLLAVMEGRTPRKAEQLALAAVAAAGSTEAALVE